MHGGTAMTLRHHHLGILSIFYWEKKAANMSLTDISNMTLTADGNKMTRQLYVRVQMSQWEQA